MHSRKIVPLGEIAEEITVGYVGPMAKEYVEFGVPFLRSLNIRPFRFDSTELKFISSEFHHKIRKSALKPGDVAVVRTGNPGISCVIPEELADANCSDLVVIRPGEKLDPEFVSYYINSITKSHIKGQLVGAIQQHFNIGAAKEIHFPNISRQEQKSLSSTLTALDAKIALNHRINCELEGLAKLLYDYWFVQYDFPLSAAQAAALGKPKLAGQPYRTSGGPMVYHDHLKREIPKGWESTTLGEVFNLYQSQTITEKDLKPDGDFFVYGANGIVGKYDRFNHESPQIALTCRGSTCGNLTRTMPFSWITGNAMVVAPRDPSLDIEYIYNVAKASGIDAIITGSGQPQITRANLQGVKTISPDPHTLASYQVFAGPISQQKINLERQNQELTALRDWLLPMLMNGQVRVTGK